MINLYTSIIIKSADFFEVCCIGSVEIKIVTELKGWWTADKQIAKSNVSSVGPSSEKNMFLSNKSPVYRSLPTFYVSIFG